MRLATRILLGLAGFLLLATVVYTVLGRGRPTRDPAGGVLMLIAAVAFCYTGLVLRGATRRARREAQRPPAPGPRGATLAHVRPTIWPFAFSVAALVLVVGLVVASRVLLPVGLVLVAAAIGGWFVEVGRPHRQPPDH
jgi:Cytochrome c oxidase subunit IV